MLEILGLGLAIVDFCGLTETLETKIDLFRQKFQALITSLRKAERFLPWFNVICFVLLTIYLWFTVTALPWPVRLIMAPIAAYIGTGIYSLILIFLFMVIYYIVLWPLVLILRLLDKPKRGTVGSIGLLLALVGVVLRFAQT